MSHRAALRTCVTIALVAAIGVSFESPAEAGPRHARLSKDLIERLNRTEGAQVIVAGTEAELQTIAARHGVRLRKSLRGAAVFEATAGQLEALSRDPGVAHLSGDAPVRRTMAVTARAVGADQVWAGTPGAR